MALFPSSFFSFLFFLFFSFLTDILCSSNQLQFCYLGVYVYIYAYVYIFAGYMEQEAGRGGEP